MSRCEFQLPQSRAWDPSQTKSRGEVTPEQQGCSWKKVEGRRQKWTATAHHSGQRGEPGLLFSMDPEVFQLLRTQGDTEKYPAGQLIPQREMLRNCQQQFVLSTFLRGI